MFPNGNVGLENSKFYEDVPARGHNACAGRHELQVPQITKRLHKDSARLMSLILKALPLATDDFRWVLDSQPVEPTVFRDSRSRCACAATHVQFVVNGNERGSRRGLAT